MASRQREWQKRNRAKGKCDCGRERVPGRYNCAACAKMRAAGMYRRRHTKANVAVDNHP